MWRPSDMWQPATRNRGKNGDLRWPCPHWSHVVTLNRVYRGINSDDWRDLLTSGLIRTDKALSLGASFTLTAAVALSYVQVGPDNPQRTGKPIYLLEVKRSDRMRRVRLGYDYLVAERPIPVGEITRVFRFDPSGQVFQSHTLGL